MSSVCWANAKRLLVDARLLVRADQVPVNVLDLRDGRDHLVFESDVGDLLVVLRDVQIAQVGAEAEAREQLLLKREAVNIELFRAGDRMVNGLVGGLAVVVELEVNVVPVGKACDRRHCTCPVFSCREGTP